MFDVWHPSTVFAVVASITGFLLTIRIGLLFYSKVFKPPVDIDSIREAINKRTRQ